VRPEDRLGVDHTLIRSTVQRNARIRAAMVSTTPRRRQRSRGVSATRDGRASISAAGPPRTTMPRPSDGPLGQLLERTGDSPDVASGSSAKSNRVLGAIDSELQGWSSCHRRSGHAATWKRLEHQSLKGFAYSSLFSSAPLTPAAQSIFAELGTTNFEQCLECLQHAGIALRALRDPTDRVNRTYEDLRDALFEAVTTMHVPWELFPQGTHVLLVQVLKEYKAVFTTNYDLSLYWSHMQTDEDATSSTTSGLQETSLRPGRHGGPQQSCDTHALP
jgi:hypothetical protein